MKAQTYLCISALLLAALAAAETNIEIVLDSSISMSEQVEGRAKIDIAKDVISNYLEGLEGANVALRLYGHRTDQCTDTELVFPFGSDKSKITAAVQKMQPMGLTPIEYSLRQAAKDLPTGEENFIILVSDGEETCGGDPCKAVKEIRASGTSFVLYAIGFGINEAGKAQLECMADTYYDASNADELSVAFQRIEKTRATRLTLVSRDPQKGTPAEKEKPLWIGSYAPTVKVFDSTRVKAVNATPTIFDMDEGGLLDLAAVNLYLEPGTYDLYINYGEGYGWLNNVKPFWMDNVVVNGGDVTTVYTDVNTGKLTVNLYKNKQKGEAGLGPLVYDCKGRSDEDCTSYEFGYTLTQDSPGLLSSSPSFDLEPGVYNFYVTGTGCMLCPSGKIMFKGVEVEAGKETVLEVCPADEGADECSSETGATSLASWSSDYDQTTIIDYGKAPTNGAAVCGDGICDVDESYAACPEDCLPGMLSVSVKDAASGAQIKDAVVRLMRKDSTLIAETSTQDGTAAFSGLPADTYYVTIEAAGYTEFDGSSDSIEITGETTVSKIIMLEPIQAVAKPPKPGTPQTGVGQSTDLLPLLLLVAGVVGTLIVIFFVLRKSSRSSGPVPLPKERESEQPDNEELKRLESQKADLEEKIRIAKSKYYKRDLDEESFREIVKENQEKLIDIESQMRKLAKRVARIEDKIS